MTVSLRKQPLARYDLNHVAISLGRTSQAKLAINMRETKQKC